MKIYQLNVKTLQLEKMKEFYTNTLEMTLISESKEHFTVMAGTTKLVFEKDMILPFYHICFRTDSHFYEYMFSKLGRMSVLLPDEDGNYDLYWEGKQAYFLDPDGNILEILERPFMHGENKNFSGWHDVGEIGMPTNSVKAMQERLSSYIVDQYKVSSDTFAFYGDQAGVVVLVKEGRHWYPTERGAAIHPIKIYVTGERDCHYKDHEYPYEIVVRKEWSEHIPSVQFRMARPTNQLDVLVEFYIQGLGLKIIGEFRNHEGYDGIILGLPSHPYHLEFTQSNVGMEIPAPTKEHLLVFYIPNLYEREKIVNRLLKMGYEAVEPENPYWSKGGVTIEDPDGWRIVLMNSTGFN